MLCNGAINTIKRDNWIRNTYNIQEIRQCYKGSLILLSYTIIDDWLLGLNALIILKIWENVMISFLVWRKDTAIFFYSKYHDNNVYSSKQGPTKIRSLSFFNNILTMNSMTKSLSKFWMVQANIKQIECNYLKRCH